MHKYYKNGFFCLFHKTSCK